MRDLRVVLRFMRRLWKRWLRPSPDSHPISLIDPREFSDLLRSGQKKDLETLAKRLSEHHQGPHLKVASKPTGPGAANPKGTGVSK